MNSVLVTMKGDRGKKVILVQGEDSKYEMLVKVKEVIKEFIGYYKGSEEFRGKVESIGGYNYKTIMKCVMKKTGYNLSLIRLPIGIIEY